MLGDGITKEDILVFMRCDDMAVVRHPDKERVQRAIQRAYEQLEKGVAYDYDFNTDDHEKFYCTELVEYCFGNPLQDSRSLFEVSSILPDAYLGGGGNFQMIWKNEKNSTKMSRKLII
jgi:hypothetical protein